MYILYAIQCKILHQTIDFRVVLGPDKIMHMKHFKFWFYLPSFSQSLFMFMTLV